MVQKLKLDPNICYLLGLYECSDRKAISLVSKDDELVERFVKLLIDEFKIDPNKIMIKKENGLNEVTTYNSKIKKMLDRALERKDKIFKYLNEYSGNYIAALFDYKGGINEKGKFYINNLDKSDSLILERLNIHTYGKSSVIRNGNLFTILIKGYSLRFL